MKMKSTIRYLVNSYRAVFKKINLGYLAFIAVLVTSGISGAFMVITDIAVAQFPGNNFIDSKGEFMEREALFTVSVYSKSSLDMGSHNDQNDWSVPAIKDGTHLVIDIVRTWLPKRCSDTYFDCTTSGSGSIEQLWLEVPQEGVEIGENEITITEWSELALMISGDRTMYFSSNGSGILKIRKQNKKMLYGGQETSFHGTAHFSFTDHSFSRLGLNQRKSIDWTF